MVVADGFLNAVGLFRLPDLKKRRVRVLGAPGTIHLATEDGVVWHTDWLLTNIIFKSEPNGKLLDWGTAPFEGGVGDWEDQMAVMGLAYDGKSLWALNNKTRRICLMEKTPAGRKVTESFARQREIDTKLRPIIMSLRCPGPVELPRDGQALTFENTVRNPFRSALEIRYAWDKLGSTWSMKPAEGTVKIAPGGKAVIRTSATLDRSRTVPLPVRTTTILIGGAKVREVDHRPVPPILRRLGTATRVRESPKVDGIIGNGEYGSAKPNANFRYFKGDGKAAHDTSFRLACDDRALYVGIVVNEPRPDGVEGEPRKRDGDVWRDDDIELFVDATFDRSTYHQFALGLKHNVQFDCIGGPRHGNFGDIKWNGEWQSATKVGNGAVAIELAIPYKTLGVGPPRTGDKWGLNLCRNRVGKGKKDGKSEMSAWCITYKGFHVPSHFGTVTFE
jgi:hypothetical protein